MLSKSAILVASFAVLQASAAPADDKRSFIAGLDLGLTPTPTIGGYYSLETPGISQYRSVGGDFGSNGPEAGGVFAETVSIVGQDYTLAFGEGDGHASKTISFTANAAGASVSNLVAGGNAGFAGQNGGFIAGLGDAGLGLGGGNIAPTVGISGGSPQLGTAGISGAIPATLNSAGAVIKPSGAFDVGSYHAGGALSLFYDASQHEVGLGFTVSAYDGTSKVFGFGSKAKKTAIPFGDRIEVRATPAPVAA